MAAENLPGSNLKSRVAPGHATRAYQQMDNLLYAVDSDILTDDDLATIADTRKWLTGLEGRLAEAVQGKKDAQKVARADAVAARKAKKEPKVEKVDASTLTKKELAALYRVQTGTPAPSKWSKPDLLKAVA